MKRLNKNKKSRAFLLLVASAVLAAGCRQAEQAGKFSAQEEEAPTGIDPEIKAEVANVTANLPFEMPAVNLPHFPDKVCSITDYGAVGDGIAKNTDAINEAIRACSEAGGGKVEIPSGEWLSGPIKMANDVDLHLDSGALLLFSPDRNDFKNGSKYDSLITAQGLHNIAITGDGSINGNGEVWRPVKQFKVTGQAWKDLIASGGVVNDGVWAPTAELLTGYRPPLLDVSYTTDVLIDGVHLENSPKFTANFYNDNDLVIRNTEVNNEYSAQNGDGLDLTSSQNVVMTNVTVNAGDDAITMKSSNTPLQNVVIDGCTVYHGHGGFVVGSNTDGGVKNVYVNNCNYIGTDTGIRLKSYVGGGGTVENIYLNNIHMKDIVSEAISFNSLYKGENEASENAESGDSRVPQFKNIHISNVAAAGAGQAVSFIGLPHIPVQDVDLDHVAIQADKGVVARYANGITMNNVRIMPRNGPVFSVRDSSDWNLMAVHFPPGVGTFMQVEGTTDAIRLVGTDPSAAKTPFVYGKDAKKDAVAVQGKE